MSRSKQHFLPQFLISGFSSRSKGSNYYVWIYRKYQIPFESNIINIAMEKGFYTYNNSIADDNITKAEQFYADLIIKLRSLKYCQVIASDLIPRFIAHMEIRTRHLRKYLIEITSLAINEIRNFFNNPENENLFLSLQIDKALDRELKNANIPNSKRAQINSLINKHKIDLHADVKNKFIPFKNYILNKLLNDLPAIVKKAQLNVLIESVSPESRVLEYNKCNWKLFYLNNDTLILGDFGLLFEVETPNKYMTFRAKDDKIIRIILPISSKHLLVGSEVEIKCIPDANSLNRTIAEYSKDFFLSSINCAAFQALADFIGSKFQLLNEKALTRYCSNLFLDKISI